MFASDKYQIALCQICGYKYKFRSLKPSSYKTWRCEACNDGDFDLKNHPQNGPFPVVPDPIAIRVPLPDVRNKTFRAETVAVVNAMVSAPTTAQTLIMNTLVSSLVSAEVWQKLELLYVLAAPNEQASGLNWVAPNSFTLVPVNLPVFEANHGWTGNGATNYLNTNKTMTPGTTFTQSSRHWGVWVLTSSTASPSKVEIGGFGGLVTFVTAAGNPSVNLARAFFGGASGPSVTVTSPIGYTVGTYSSGVANVIKNNTWSTSSGPFLVSANMPPNVINVLRSGSGSYSDRQVAIAHVGGALTSADVSVLYSSFNTYLSAVGAH